MANISTTGTDINEASNPYADLQSISTTECGFPEGVSVITATATYWNQDNVRHELKSSELVDGKIEVVKCCIPLTYVYYGIGQTPPERVIKEIYGVVDGQIVLERTITGRVVPEQIIEESFEFDEQA